MHLTPPLNDRERTTLGQLRTIADAVHSTAPSPDDAVLRALAGRVGGRMGTTELRRSLGWEKSRLSHHLTRMERRGVVTREQCRQDRRAWFVTLTDAGRSAAGAAADAHTDAVRAVLSRLTDDDVAALHALAGRLHVTA
jgi:DNA-binding MarR family transcriptional regulator